MTAGVHVLAPALPGFGGTTALPRNSTDFTGYGDWASEFLLGMGIDQPALVIGHSFGGGVAITLAHDHADQVRALVLVNSVAALLGPADGRSCARWLNGRCGIGVSIFPLICSRCIRVGG